MMNGLLGKKIGMTQIFKDTGEIVPVTVIEAGPCPVLQVKNKDKEGYSSVQLGFDSKKEKSVNKPQMGLFKKININPVRFISEFRTEDTKDIKVSDNIRLDIFTIGDYVDISGVSIGKGFQGGIKRWHWKGGPKTHGSMHHRRPGAIGASSAPSRVFKGQHLPGHMGNSNVTEQNHEIVDIDIENNLLLVKGGVPGPKGSYLSIRKSFKKKKEPKKIVATAKDDKAKKIKPKVEKKK